jgi:hypothetical protein
MKSRLRCMLEWRSFWWQNLAPRWLLRGYGMAILHLHLQTHVKSHTHSTYLFLLIFMLEAGVCYEHYGKFCTALYDSIQLHTAPITLFGKWCIAPVSSYTWFILAITTSYGRNISVVWNTLFHPPIFFTSPPSPSALLNVSNTSHDHSMVANYSPIHIMDFLFTY